MASCVFCEITLQARAHLVVIPSTHAAAIWDMDARDLADLVGVVRALAERLRDRLGATGVNILHATGRDAQQSIPHVHFHVLARFAGDGIDAWPALARNNVDRRELVRLLA